MRFKCDAGALRKALGIVKPAAARLATMPILASVKITATADSVSVLATDLELGLTADVEPFEQPEPGEALVGCSALLAVLKPLKGAVTLSSSPAIADAAAEPGQAPELRVATATGAAVLACSPLEEYPTIPDPNAGWEWVELEAEPFYSALASVAHCSSRDETRYNLNSVMLDALAGGAAVLVATDGHRLATAELAGCRLPWSHASDSARMIPRAAVAELLKRIKPVRGVYPELELGTAGTGAVQFRGPGWRIVARTIDGEFPNYRQVIPKAFAVAVAVDRAELESSLEAVGSLAAERSGAVKMTVNCGLVLESNNPDAGAARATLEAERSQPGGWRIPQDPDEPESDGQEFEAAFNYRYLLAALGALEGKTAVLRFTAENPSGSPVQLIEPATDGYRLQLVMPMHV